ncbi:hypothetical protein PIB30_097467, partial [Stylosanthes scabra]|nr:hypothetical protein [Stylosanthes scabra]
MKFGNLALGLSQEPTHMRGSQLGAHAYAWHATTKVIPGAKLLRICVDINQPPTHMRSSLLSRQAAYAHTSETPCMHVQQPRICVASHVQHHVYAWPSTSSLTFRRGASVTKEQSPRICVDIRLSPT